MGPGGMLDRLQIEIAVINPNSSKPRGIPVSYLIPGYKITDLFNSVPFGHSSVFNQIDIIFTANTDDAHFIGDRV